MSLPDTPVGSFADKLTIETPEQTALDFAVAGIGSRFLALALDTLVQFAVGLLAGIAAGLLLSGLSISSPKASLWTAAIFVIFYFLLYFGYYAIFEIVWNGQTPGKRKVGIRVIKDSGRPLTPAESIGRNLMRIVDWLPFLYGIGMLSAILTKENKRLGDLVVGSLVVREGSFSDLKPTWQSTDLPFGTAALPSAPLGADRLSAEEIALVESFLNRRLDLMPDVRSRMADQIFLRIKPKLTLTSEHTLSTDRLLELVALERRAASHYQ